MGLLDIAITQAAVNDAVQAIEGRFEPYYAVIGKDLKVTMYAGLGTAEITDPEDQPIADGPAKMAASAGRILKALRGEAQQEPAEARPAGTPAAK